MVENPEPEIAEIAKIEEFIKTSVEKAGAKGAVLGLSGGIDSAVTVFLAVRALGKDRVLALLLPEKGITPPEDIVDAREVAGLLGIRYIEMDISPILERYDEILPSEKVREIPRLVAGNLKARVRMTLLYWYANLENLLVLGTGNKTEIMLGYSTKHGDAAADILPLGGLYKKDVRALAKSLGVPRRIIEKDPTAGLWPGQTDEGDGITYADGLHPGGLEKGLGREELSRSCGLKKVELVMERIGRSRHKRRCRQCRGIIANYAIMTSFTISACLQKAHICH
jgi:NAD+ synthase